jgi:hypothetical protein
MMSLREEFAREFIARAVVIINDRIIIIITPRKRSAMAEEQVRRL